MYLTNTGEANDLSAISNEKLLKLYSNARHAERKLNDEIERLKTSKEKDPYSLSMLEEQLKDNQYELEKIKNEIFDRSLTDKMNEIDKRYKEKLSDIDDDVDRD